MWASGIRIIVHRIIEIRADAPAQPAYGAPCNGCGVCCALETCPAARLRFWRRTGPCPALEWVDETRRYVCGLLTHPAAYLPIPGRLAPLARRLLARSIAAGQGCDCTAQAHEQP